MQREFNLLLLFLLAFSNAFAGVKELRNKLDAKRTEIHNLAARIKTIESQIGSKNDDYLENVESYNRVEKKMRALASKLEVIEINIINERNRVRTMMMQMINDKADTSDDLSELKVHLQKKILHRKLSSLDDQSRDLEELKKTVSFYSNNLSGIKENEKQLYDLIVDFENRKKQLSHEYKRKLEEKNNLENDYDSLVAKLRTKKKIRKTKGSLSLPFALTLPLENFQTYKANKLGVTFHFAKQEPVRATAAGTVSYVGKLSAYGNLIMIDHGNELRTILLGDLKHMVAKGKRVSAGEVIGMTELDAGEGRNVYFELRKKNKAQNTMALLKKYNNQFKKI
jgi:murein DD-endopeptidase MepM/ murein hydrolase activator NlpD